MLSKAGIQTRFFICKNQISDKYDNFCLTISQYSKSPNKIRIRSDKDPSMHSGYTEFIEGQKIYYNYSAIHSPLQQTGCCIMSYKNHVVLRARRECLVQLYYHHALQVLNQHCG